MKRRISLILISVLALSALSACKAEPTAAILTPHASLLTSASSSDFSADLAWLEDRLGKVPDGLTVGLGDSLGLDMSAFEDDGYMIRSDGAETVVAAKTSDGLDRAIRKYAKAYEKGEADTLDVTYHEGYRIKRLTVAGADISEFTVVRPENPNENAKFAAAEFRTLVEKACGVTIPAVAHEKAPDGHKIVFAFSDDPSLRYDGYSYEVKDGSLYITGARARGCMYAVWRFFENECGWHGLIFGDSVLTPADHVDVPEGTKKAETPAFQYMDLYGNTHKVYKNDRTLPNSEQNSFGSIPNACHGMQGNQFCDEDFTVRQICYTSEERYEECYENVMNHINYFLAIGYKIGEGLKYVDVAQGDNSGFCTCKNCRAVEKEEGNVSGAIVRFTNRLSEEINEELNADAPLYFLIFAYGGSNMAPKKTAPNEYIYVTFCYDANCSNHRVDGSECTDGVILGLRERRFNSLYEGWIQSWSEKTKNIYVWFYELDNGLQQYFFFDNLYYDFEHFHDLGVQGIFFQCQNYGLGTQFIAHMLVAELNWNMGMTEEEFDALYNELLEREYGEGWQNIRRYLDSRNVAQDLVGCYHCWNWSRHSVIEKLYDGRYTAAHYDESIALIEECAALADCAMQEKQSWTLSLHCMYEGCYSGYLVAYLAKDEERIKYLCDTYDTLVHRMTECGFDITHVVTVDGAVLSYETDLLTEAWKWWIKKEADPYDERPGAVYKYYFELFYEDVPEGVNIEK